MDQPQGGENFEGSSFTSQWEAGVEDTTDRYDARDEMPSTPTVVRGNALESAVTRTWAPEGAGAPTHDDEDEPATTVWEEPEPVTEMAPSVTVAREDTSFDGIPCCERVEGADENEPAPLSAESHRWVAGFAARPIPFVDETPTNVAREEADVSAVEEPRALPWEPEPDDSFAGCRDAPRSIGDEATQSKARVPASEPNGHTPSETLAVRTTPDRFAPGDLEGARARGYQPDLGERRFAMWAHVACALTALTCWPGFLGAWVVHWARRDATPFFLYHVNQAAVFQGICYLTAVSAVVLSVVFAMTLVSYVLLPVAAVCLAIAVLSPLWLAVLTVRGRWSGYPIVGTRVRCQWRVFLQ